MAQTLSIAACQLALRPVGSFAEFAEHARELLDGAHGADLVLLRELFSENRQIGAAPTFRDRRRRASRYRAWPSHVARTEGSR